MADQPMTDEPGGAGIRRREFVKVGLAGAALLSSADFLAACGSSSSSPSGAQTSTGPSGGTPVKGGTLRVGLLSAGSAETLDVRKPFNFPDFIRLFNLLDPLFFQGPHGLVSPGSRHRGTSQQGLHRLDPPPPRWSRLAGREAVYRRRCCFHAQGKLECAVRPELQPLQALDQLQRRSQARQANGRNPALPRHRTVSSAHLHPSLPHHSGRHDRLEQARGNRPVQARVLHAREQERLHGEQELLA